MSSDAAMDDVAVNAVLWAIDLWSVVHRIFVRVDVEGHYLVSSSAGKRSVIELFQCAADGVGGTFFEVAPVKADVQLVQCLLL